MNNMVSGCRELELQKFRKSNPGCTRAGWQFQQPPESPIPLNYGLRVKFSPLTI